MAGNTCARPLAALAGVMLLGSWATAWAQSPGVTCRGELKSTSPQSFSSFVVLLDDNSHRDSRQRVDVRGDGTFEVRNLTPGDYIVTVMTLSGELVTRQIQSINPFTGIEIRLPEPKASRPGTGTVSIRELRHPPSKRAVHSIVEAQKFSSSGDFSKAAEALERAVRESPDYVPAHVNLAAQYARLGRLQEAAAELDRALEIGGPNGIALCNLAFVQMNLGKREEAIANVRAGLRLQPELLSGHFVLGALLAQDPGTREEAVQELRKASDLKSARALLLRLGVQ